MVPKKMTVGQRAADSAQNSIVHIATTSSSREDLFRAVLYRRIHCFTARLPPRPLAGRLVWRMRDNPALLSGEHAWQQKLGQNFADDWQ